MVSYTLCTAAMIGRGLEELCVHDTAKGFFSISGEILPRMSGSVVASEIAERSATLFKPTMNNASTPAEPLN